jgi:hypothetical protein
VERPTTPRADSPEPIPAEIAAWTGPIRSIERPFQGENYAVTLLDAAAGRFVLKRGDTPRAVAELERESRVLEALQDQAPLVARPAGHVIAGSRGHFLFTCIEGENLLGPLLRGDAGERHRWIAAFGAMLRRVHEWRPDLPRPDDWLSDAVAQTQARRAAAATSQRLARPDGPRGPGPDDARGDAAGVAGADRQRDRLRPRRLVPAEPDRPGRPHRRDRGLVGRWLRGPALRPGDRMPDDPP